MLELIRLAKYGKELFWYLPVLHLNSFTRSLLYRVFTVVPTFVKKEWSVFKFLDANVVHNWTLLCSSVLVEKVEQASGYVW